MSMQIQPENQHLIKGVLDSAGSFKPLKPEIDLEQFLITEKIKIKQSTAVVTSKSVIWPWHFPAELKTELSVRAQIIRLKPKDHLTGFDIRQIQLAFLVQGSVKLVSSLPGLKHRVIDLFFPGETLALSQNDADGLSPKLIACSDSFIYVLPKKDFYQLCKAYPELFEFTSYLKDISLIRTQRQQLVLGNFSAEKKLAWFLVNACRKLNVNTRKAAVLKLPMSRVDISDYLNITPETLCRSLQTLHGRGLIHSTKNIITVLNYPGLLAS
jgi:CRP-like cAMP-binding protein